MKKLLFAGALGLALVSGAAHATVDITVTPWLAPNAFGSPSFAPAAANAVNALYNGQTSGGTPGTPSYFHGQSNVTSAQAIVTGFPAWMGVADPGTVFGSAFSAELGNRMTFGVSVVGSSSADLFSISQMSFTANSNDVGNQLHFGFGTGAYDYSAGNYEGVLYGANGVLGGGDDTFITSGLNTQQVNAIFGRGSGNSFAAYCPGCTTTQQQAAIDSAASFPGQPTTFTGTYSLGGVSGSGTFNIGVPEPASWALMLVGFGGLGAVFRRRRHMMALAIAA